MKTEKLNSVSSFYRQLLAGVALAGLTGCGSGVDDATLQALRESAAQATETAAQVENLKNELAALKAQQTNFAVKLDSVDQAQQAPSAKGSASPAAGGGPGFPALLPKEVLEQGLQKLALERKQEMKAALSSKGLEVTSYGEPTIEMPDALTHPYAARLDLSIRKDGRIVTVPLTFRADWEGHWKTGSTEELVKTIGTAASAAPAALPTSGPTASLPSRAGSAGPSPTRFPSFSDQPTIREIDVRAAAAAPPAAPPPPARSGPNIPGVDVKEVDLRGKSLLGK